MKRTAPTSTTTTKSSATASKKSLSRSHSTVTSMATKSGPNSPTPSVLNNSSMQKSIAASTTTRSNKRTLDTTHKASDSSAAAPLSSRPNSPRVQGNEKNTKKTLLGAAGGSGGGAAAAGGRGGRGGAGGAQAKSPRGNQGARRGPSSQISPRARDNVALTSDLSDAYDDNTNNFRTQPRTEEEKKRLKLRRQEERSNAKESLRRTLQADRAAKEKARLARTSGARTKIPAWLLAGAPEILESFDHPADVVALMQTNRQIRDTVVLANIQEQFGALAAAFVLTSKEYLPPVGNPRPAAALAKKIKKQIKKQFYPGEPNSSSSSSSSTSDDEGDHGKKYPRSKKKHAGSDTDEYREGSDDTRSSNDDNRRIEEADDDDEFDDEAHTASSILRLFSSTSSRHVSFINIVTNPQQAENSDNIAYRNRAPVDAALNLSGASLPDKRSGDVFFRCILSPLLENNEQVTRAEFSLLPRKANNLLHRPETMFEEATGIVPTAKSPLSGDFRDTRMDDALKTCNDIGLVNDRTVSLLGQRNHDLRYLDVSGRSAVTGVGLSVVACCCTRLLHLNLSYTNVTDSSMCLLASYCRHLKNLSIEGCAKLTDRAVSSVSIWCRELVALNVSRTRGAITDLSLGEIIARCPVLERLVAHSCNGAVTDATLIALTKPPFVTDVSVFTEREKSSLRSSAVENTDGEFNNSPVGARSSLTDLRDESFFGRRGSPSPPRRSHHVAVVDAAAGESTSINSSNMHSNVSKPQAPCLWTTLKEVDVRGSHGKVTWTGGLLNILQHTATEETKRRRQRLKMARMAKLQQGDVDSHTTLPPLLVVYVDVEVLDEVPEESPVMTNVKSMLKFSTVEDF